MGACQCSQSRVRQGFGWSRDGHIVIARLHPVKTRAFSPGWRSHIWIGLSSLSLAVINSRCHPKATPGVINLLPTFSSHKHSELQLKTELYRSWTANRVKGAKAASAEIPSQHLSRLAKEWITQHVEGCAEVRMVERIEEISSQ